MLHSSSLGLLYLITGSFYLHPSPAPLLPASGNLKSDFVSYEFVLLCFWFHIQVRSYLSFCLTYFIWVCILVVPRWVFKGFPGGWAGKEFACNPGDLGLISGLGRSPGEGNDWLPTPVFWPGEFHGQYSPWGRRVGHNCTTFTYSPRWVFKGFPGGTSGKESACQCRRHRFDP